MPRIFRIYLFTGDDNYLKKEAVRKLKEALLGKESEAFNFNTYEIGKCDIREVMDTLRIIPFISRKRLVILKDVGLATAAEQKILIEYAKNPSQNSCLILDASRKGLSGEFYKTIKRCVREVSFTAPKRASMKAWIQKEVKARGKIIRYDAASLLKELKEDDFDVLGNEIDKLITYIGRRPTIMREDVEKIVGSSIARNVFEFVDALSRKDAKEALAISKELLRSKKKIPEILGMVGWQFRKIKKAKSFLKEGASKESTTDKCDIPPFYMERFMKGIKSFTSGELDENMDYLLDVDYSIKRGYLKPEVALEILIIKICGRR
jgi:DNA polymerase-3 subunit delta